MRLTIVTTIALLFVGLQPSAASASDSFPDDSTIRSILATRAAGREGIAMVVGVVTPQGRRLVVFGNADGNTLFEIGSVAKVLTALLLADMAHRGEIRLNEPVMRYLPAGTIVPARGGHVITLVDLATHTSGLPFMPSETSVTREQLYESLARLNPSHETGRHWDYSNLGYWLLGEAMTFRAKMDFETAMRTRVLEPLKLHDTTAWPTAAQKARMAVGHDANMHTPMPASSVPGYAIMTSAGVGWYSTADDLLSLLSAALGIQRSPLSPAMAAMLETHRPGPNGETQQALGWLVSGDAARPFFVHDGGTFGFASSIAWDPKMRAGVVVLSNQVSDVGDIARHLLRPEVPLANPSIVRHTAIALDAATLDSYQGRYQATGEGVFVVTRDGNALTIDFPAEWGLPRLRVQPESRFDFFATELPVRITFQTNGRMIVFPPRGQKGVTATRVE